MKDLPSLVDTQPTAETQTPSSRRWLAAFVTGVALVGALAIAVVATRGSSGSHRPRLAAAATDTSTVILTPTTIPALINGVNQTDLQACIASGGDCPDTIPGLKACMSAHLICNWSAYRDLQANNPVAQSDPGVALTKSDAEAIAHRIAKTSSTPAAADTAPTYARLMRYGDVLAATGNAPSAVVNPDRQVWVVTVEAPITTDGSPSVAPVTVNAYTAVLDAQTGKAIDVCIGCDSLAPGAKALP